MKRRGLFALLGGVAAGAPVVVLAKDEPPPLDSWPPTAAELQYRDEFIKACDEQFIAMHREQADYLLKGRKS